MLKIRLARRGAKGRPAYSIVVADSRAPRDGRFREIVGRYQPLRNRDDPDRIVLNRERIGYWLSVGAQPTDRVRLFLSDAGLAEPAQRRPKTKSHLPKAKAQERLEAQRLAQEASTDNPEQASA